MNGLYLLLILSVGLAAPAFAQENIVINEIDINPPADDAKSASEWIELYNPTDSPIDVGGWKITPSSDHKTLTLPPRTTLRPDQHAIYSYQTLWFVDVGESVGLYDAAGNLVDKTPTIADKLNDFASWQRIYDGYDNDEESDWKFAKSTAGTSNGKLIDNAESDVVTVTVVPDMQSYTFGDTVDIAGTVSQRVLVEKPRFQPAAIELSVSGPVFNTAKTLYPDANLGFHTSIQLYPFLGIVEGTYDISVSYSDASAQANFTVAHTSAKSEAAAPLEFAITTDKSGYMPGEQVIFEANTTRTIQYQGLAFTVLGPDAAVVSSGVLYPTDGRFKTSFPLSTVDPSYGTYVINAKYGEELVVHTFNVTQDVRDDALISLSADAEAYGLGDTVTISGRLNQILVGTLDLEIVQTTQTSIGSASSNAFNIKDILAVDGDGTFGYTFVIPDSNLRYGDYKITVSKDIGEESLIISAVKDPQNYTKSQDPVTISTDKRVYVLGDSVQVSGFVKEPFSTTSYRTGAAVKISILDEDGKPLQIPIKVRGAFRDPVLIDSTFTAIPELSGRYSQGIDLHGYTPGNYTILAKYQRNVASDSFTIIDPLVLKDGAVITLNKEVYGLGENVVLSGLLPPTGHRSVVIDLLRPDGTRSTFGAPIDNQRFSWSWVTPITERSTTITPDGSRNIVKSNLGIHEVIVGTDSYSTNLFFKVSSNPGDETLSHDPITVTTSKPTYAAGEDLNVLGNVVLLAEGDTEVSAAIPVVVHVASGTFPYRNINGTETRVYPESGGSFSTIHKLPVSLFAEGLYTVKASYGSESAKTTFNIEHDFVFDPDAELELLAKLDMPAYRPGQTVTVTGQPTKLVHLEPFDLVLIKKSHPQVICGEFYCGVEVSSSKIRPSPSGSFTHQITLPDDDSSVGFYEAKIVAAFDETSLPFNVTVSKPSVVIEKRHQIADDTISITVGKKRAGSETLTPRVLSVSLFTPSTNDTGTVNLQVLAADGTCIIGPDCMVSENTRKPGQIYEVVNASNTALNVRYTGPDAKIEKFSISPVLPEPLPDADWTVNVLKDEQPSRLFYKVTYRTAE